MTGAKKPAEKKPVDKPNYRGAVELEAALNTDKYKHVPEAQEILRKGGSVIDAEVAYEKAKLKEEAMLKAAARQAPNPNPELVAQEEARRVAANKAELDVAARQAPNPKPAPAPAPEPVQPEPAPAPEPVAPEPVQEPEQELPPVEPAAEAMKQAAAQLADKSALDGKLNPKEKKSFGEMLKTLWENWGIPAAEVLQAAIYGYQGIDAKRLYEIRREKEDKESDKAYVKQLEQDKRAYEDMVREQEQQFERDTIAQQQQFQADQAELARLQQMEMLGKQLSAEEKLEKMRISNQLAAQRASGKIPASVEQYVSGGK